jgi:hypothetical protein
MSIFHSKTTLDSRKRLQLCWPQHTLNCSCGVDLVTELAKGHQLAHAHKPAMKKNFHNFPF